MRTNQNLSKDFSNWESVAFVIIGEILVAKSSSFSRSEIMKFSTLENARKLLMFFGHKKDPSRLENTLQRTIQNLRNKGFIKFLGHGDYILTEEGRIAINTLNPKLFELWEELKGVRVQDLDKIIENHKSQKRKAGHVGPG